MIEIYNQLLLIGNALEVRNIETLFQNQIQAVVDLALDEPPASVPRRIIYCRYPLVDGSGNQKIRCQMAISTVHQLIANQQRTLIACSAGLSRSPVIAAFALASVLETSPQKVLGSISQKKRLEVNQVLWNEMISHFPENK